MMVCIGKTMDASVYADDNGVEETVYVLFEDRTTLTHDEYVKRYKRKYEWEFDTRFDVKK